MKNKELHNSFSEEVKQLQRRSKTESGEMQNAGGSKERIGRSGCETLGR